MQLCLIVFLDPDPAKSEIIPKLGSGSGINFGSGSSRVLFLNNKSKVLKMYKFKKCVFLIPHDLQFSFWWKILWTLMTNKVKSNVFFNINKPDPDQKLMPKPDPNPENII